MRKLSKIVFLLLSTHCSHLCYSMEQRMDLETPQRSAPASSIEPTPGQLVSKRQAEILTKERFSNVLGEDVVTSWGIDWSVFTNPTLEFDNPQKRNQLRILFGKIKKTPGYRDQEELKSLYLSLVYLKDDMEAVHADRLDQISIRFFTELYPTALKIASLEKQGGVQLGERIKITLPDGCHLLYHVKTHSEGRLSEKSTAPKLVNPQELLAYKILEGIGFGCEVHFFEKSPEDVYIATLDACYLAPGKTGEFNLFHRASGDLGRGNDAEYGTHIWGTLNTVIQSIKKDGQETDWPLVEECIEKDDVAQNFMNQQATLDMITRIMRLCDLLNNPENFGFISCKELTPRLRVIDFRVMDLKELIRVDRGDFGGFLEGNGLYDYASSHKTMAYTLRYRTRDQRVSTALNVMNTHLRDIQTVVDSAYAFVLDYLKKNTFAPVCEELFDKLNIYAQAIHKNVQFFKAELEDWSPEKDRQREEERQRIINKAK